MQFCVLVLIAAGAGCGPSSPAAPGTPLPGFGGGLLVSGTVTNAVTGEAIIQARIAVPTNAVLTRAKGYYEFGVARGLQTFRVSHPDYLEVTRELNITRASTVDFALQPK